MADRVAEAMEQLYAVGPDDFMAVRGRLVAAAKEAGDKEAAREIGKLRKPSLAAWAVNLAAREAADVVAELSDLGERMRSAQSRLDTKALTGMRPERDAAVDAFVRAATEVVEQAGRNLSAAAQQDVRATAIAALADERASAAVASGQLTRALSYSGFGEVDLAEAVARTTGGAILTVVRGGGGASTTRRKARPSRGKDAQEPEEQGKPEELEEADDAEKPDEDVDTQDGQDVDEDELDEEPEDEEPEDEAAVSREELAALVEEAEQRASRAAEAVTRAREKAQETRERLEIVERQLGKAREADERARAAVTEAVRARKQAEAERDAAQRALDALD